MFEFEKVYAALLKDFFRQCEEAVSEHYVGRNSANGEEVDSYLVSEARKVERKLRALWIVKHALDNAER